MAVIKGKNCSLKVAGSTITQIKSISWGGLTNPLTPVKHIGGTSVQKISADLPDYGDMAVSLDFDPSVTEHLQLFNDFKSGVEREYVFTLSNTAGSTFTFDGIPSDFPFDEVAPGSVVSITVTIGVNDVVLDESP